MCHMVNNSPAVRRRKNEPGGRSIVHKVKVSEEEEARLQRASASHGLTISALLAEGALDPKRVQWRRIWTNELLGLRRQLAEFPQGEDLAKLTGKINEHLDRFPA